jgi:hypothetical protein
MLSKRQLLSRLPYWQINNIVARYKNHKFYTSEEHKFKIYKRRTNIPQEKWIKL